MNFVINNSQEPTYKRFRKKRTKKNAKQITIFVVLLLLLPFYPASGSYLYHKTGGIEVYNVDESTILESYDGVDYFDKVSIDSGGFMEANIALEDNRDWQNQEEIVKYLVKPGDTLWELSESFGVSTNTIKWANKLGNGPIRSGQELTILRVDGIVYVVKKGDSVKAIAKKHSIADKIPELLAVNKMQSEWELKANQKIILPGAKPLPKPKPKPVIRPNPTIVTRNTSSGNHNYAGPTEYLGNTDANGYYPLTLRVSSGCRNFYFGNCTCFVAKYKNVTWRGNAKDWLRNAQAQWVPTGNTPTAGAIVVYAWPGTHPVYGHVGIVRKVEANHIIVTDMNYRRFNEVTTRRERVNHRAIIGYIYVD